MLYATIMKKLIILGFIGLTFFSCKKEKTYLRFNEKQLVFVNYSKGQSLKFIDTASVPQTLIQDQYRREFREQVGLYGKTDALTEEYEVSYRSENNGHLGFHISVDAISRSLSIEFLSYYNNILTSPDSLQSTIPSLTINGQTYTDVYTLKMFKYSQYINNSDTATLFHNKQFGVIQLLFPNGKKVIRTD